jgi:alpha-galactosidase
MISHDSELFKAHPDWALSVPDHKRSTGRDQYVLDLSRKDVRDYVVDAISTVLSSASIDYVKWDMNRNLTEIGSLSFPEKQQGEIATRYVLGLYDIVQRITSRFENILFESCSGGGRRFDMGMLCYMPQVWTSDNTDAVARQRIQYGTSYLYPPVTMGAHVSAVPNHQLNRITSMLTRFTCAMSGNFGYEMDLGKLSPQEQEEVKYQIGIYKKYRETLQTGNFIRLISPFEGDRNETSWSFVSQDQSEVILMYFRNLVKNGMPLTRIRFKGLKKNAKYQCVVHECPSVLSVKHEMSGQVFSAEYLENRGLIMDKCDSDFAAHLYVLKEVN